MSDEGVYDLRDDIDEGCFIGSYLLDLIGEDGDIVDVIVISREVLFDLRGAKENE